MVLFTLASCVFELWTVLRHNSEVCQWKRDCAIPYRFRSSMTFEEWQKEKISTDIARLFHHYFQYAEN